MEEKHTKGVCLQMTRKIELVQVEVFGEELSSRREGCGQSRAGRILGQRHPSRHCAFYQSQQRRHSFCEKCTGE